MTDLTFEKIARNGYNKGLKFGKSGPALEVLGLLKATVDRMIQSKREENDG